MTKCISVASVFPSPYNNTDDEHDQSEDKMTKSSGFFLKEKENNFSHLW